MSLTKVSRNLLSTSIDDNGTGTAVTIDSSNRLGIGSSNPQGTLHISAGTSGDATLILEADTDNNNESDNPYMVFQQDGGLQISAIGHLGQDSTDENCLQIANSISNGNIEFLTGSTTGYANSARRMRINSSGDILIGTTSNTLYSASTGGGMHFNANGPTTIARTSNAACLILNKTNSGYGPIQQFRRNGSTVGDIQVTASSTSYNTSSDYRLKENVVPLTSATERLKQLRPLRFNFISDSITTVDGFLAHEVSEIVPEAITGQKDAVDADGNPEYQGIDQSKLVPLLVATIQEQDSRISSLEARIAALEVSE